jgi:hypothetical protein
MDPCLCQKAICNNIKYNEIDNGNIIIDDDYNNLGELRYIEYKNLEIGYIEKNDKGSIFYNNKIYDLFQAKWIRNQNIKNNTISTFDYSLAELALISLNGSRYICINFLFNGMGESGRYQQIKNALIFNIKSSNKDLYYAAKDTTSCE